MSGTPTAPNPATSTVDPSRTPATASAVVLTCLSITAEGSLVRYGPLDHRVAPGKAHFCSRVSSSTVVPANAWRTPGPITTALSDLQKVVQHPAKTTNHA